MALKGVESEGALSRLLSCVGSSKRICKLLVTLSKLSQAGQTTQDSCGIRASVVSDCFESNIAQVFIWKSHFIQKFSWMTALNCIKAAESKPKHICFWVGHSVWLALKNIFGFGFFCLSKEPDNPMLAGNGCLVGLFPPFLSFSPVCERSCRCL